MDITVEFILEWAIFPDSFCSRWESEIARNEPCDGGVIIEVHAEYLPGCPGRYDGKPENCYPAEEPEVEICASIIIVRRASHALDRELDPAFLSVVHQYAMDWLELHESEVKERLLEHGNSIHQDEIAEILADIELDIDRRRDRQIEDAQFADFAARIWEGMRTNAPDEKP